MVPPSDRPRDLVRVAPFIDLMLLEEGTGVLEKTAVLRNWKHSAHRTKLNSNGKLLQVGIKWVAMLHDPCTKRWSMHLRPNESLKS